MNQRAACVCVVLSALSACATETHSSVARRTNAHNAFSLSTRGSNLALADCASVPPGSALPECDSGPVRPSAAEIMARVAERFRTPRTFTQSFALYVTPPGNTAADGNAGFVTFSARDQWGVNFAVPVGLRLSCDGSTVVEAAAPPRWGQITTPASESEWHAALRLFSGAVESLAEYSLALDEPTQVDGPNARGAREAARASWVVLVPRVPHATVRSMAMLVDDRSSVVRELIVDSRSGFTRRFVFDDL